MSESVSLDAPAWQNQRTHASEQAERMVLTYRGWDAYERAHGGPSIVDFDLSSVPGSASFTSRRDVLSALCELYNQLNDATDEEDFLRTRILGSISYLRALMGQQIAFANYLHRTLGVEAAPFPVEEVEVARNAVSESLAPFEIVMRVEDRKRFERDLVIRDPSVIKRGIVGNQDLWLGRLAPPEYPHQGNCLSVCSSRKWMLTGAIGLAVRRRKESRFELMYTHENGMIVVSRWLYVSTRSAGMQCKCRSGEN